ncbi:PAS domain S-box protein [Natronomonas salina]|uniref:PAS domain-containing sensor histidine kinase n=1 Tax=Natronomonas salina TaxID=1710540 RepID=UPI0015B4B168|nr:PAS domain S-box protein [Natronomonas salina]QLD90076.1 PAS domain S-box protein [Natronomonas salina]
MSDGRDVPGGDFVGGDDAGKSLQRFRATVDLIDGGLYQLDPEGRFVAVDDDFLASTGYARTELLGERFSLLLDDDDGETAERGIDDFGADGATDVDTVEVTFRTADGERLPVELRQRRLGESGRDGGTLGVAREIAGEDDRQERVETPLDADETTTSVLEEADVGVFILDPEFHVAWVDSTAASYFGLDQAATIGRDKRELVHETLTDRVADGGTFAERVLAAYDANDYVERFECRVRAGDADRWLEHRSRPIEAGRYAGGRVELYYDISDQRRRAHQLQRLNEAVREWLEQDSRTAVAERACRHVREILNMDINGVFLHDAASAELRPVAWSAPAADLFGEVPTFREGEGVAWRVFESGQSEVYDDVREAPDVYDAETPIRSEIVLSIGDHGVVEIGSTEPGAFDDGDLMLAEIVASTLEVTFDRIDNQERLEARKAELETELGQILDRVTDAFYAVDDEFRFTHVNERTEELLGYAESELLGESLWDVFPEAAEIDTVRTAFRTAMDDQEPTSYERYDETLDLWIEANLYPSESGISVYFRDVTERKEREQALEESNERLEQFAYAASHDLQEPLRMITSYLQLLERRYTGELDEEAEEFIEFAVDGAQRMREMIDGLLEYSRVESRGDAFEAVDLDAVLDDVRDDLQLTLEESDADLEVGPLPRVEGDASQLRQLFQNLLENAVEYSGDEPPRIRVEVSRDGDSWVTVSVDDDGIGIDPDDADRIFEIFQRLHSREDHSGAGIGLALCERIVERHGGDIWVDSDPGAGATFYVTLPAGPDA